MRRWKNAFNFSPILPFERLCSRNTYVYLQPRAMSSNASTPTMQDSESPSFTREREGPSTFAFEQSVPRGSSLGASEKYHDDALIEVLQTAVPMSSTEEITRLISNAKNSKELQEILQNVAYRHHLASDSLNGHGYRVAVLQALTAVAPRTACLEGWMDAVQRFRKLGFVVTRAFAAEGFTTIRAWLSGEFEQYGRSPHLIIGGLSALRTLTKWCKEDRLVMDHVLYTRQLLLLTMMVSFMDRQNLHRASFPADFVKRDGIVVEWVVNTERCVDFDETVLQCDAVLEEILQQMRQDVPSRPAFSVLYRLMDYYFATDNVEKMIAVMEDAETYGLPVAESSTAKLLQLACGMNHPSVPALFLRWRASLPQCVLATPDFSRLLFYFSRSGGGHPCPVCGEPYNHRYVSVYVWLETPPHQRKCPVLQLARRQKGVLEECPGLPQNRDWSREAWGLWELAKERFIEWGPVEWRGFLLCCMFGSSGHSDYPAPLKALALVQEHLTPERMDDFLRATFMRFLRHHQPSAAGPTLRSWSQQRIRMSPIALQEALMAASYIDEGESCGATVAVPEGSSSASSGVQAVLVEAEKPESNPANVAAVRGQRFADMQFIFDAIKTKDSYVMPYTRRVLERRKKQLFEQGGGSGSKLSEDAASDGSDSGEGKGKKEVSAEQALFDEIISMRPRRISLLDMKDSASDFGIGTSKKNVFIPYASF